MRMIFSKIIAVQIFSDNFVKPQVWIISNNEYYRKLAKTKVRPTDYVLEIGCSYGFSTRLLAKTAQKILAIDISYSCVERAKQECHNLANVQIERLDAREIPLLKALLPQAQIVFIDIGGNSPPENALSLLNLCLKFYQPREVIIRNIRLARLVELIQGVEISGERDFKGTADSYFQALHLLNKSFSQNNRKFALSKLKRIKTIGE